MKRQKSQRDLSPSATKIIAATFANAGAAPDPQTSAQTLARGTTIVGQMLENLSDQYGSVGQRYAKWVTNVGTVCWYIVELSVPRSLGDIFLRYWLKLASVVAIFFLVLGALTRGGMIECETGLVLLTLVLLISVARAYFRRFMAKLHLPGWMRIVASFVAVVVVLVLFCALLSGLRLEYRYLVEVLRK